MKVERNIATNDSPWASKDAMNSTVGKGALVVRWLGLAGGSNTEPSNVEDL